MRKITILFITIGLLIGSCNEDELNTENKLPSCNIIEPNNGENIEEGETISISVDAEDGDGNIVEVSCYIDSIQVGIKRSKPYNFTWNTKGEEIGNHTIRVAAKDNDGECSEAEIIVTIMHLTGTVEDYDGNIYNTVKIGNQWWMAENLKTTHYHDGTEINLVLNEADWDALLSIDKAMCYHKKNTYGILYNWSATMNDAVSSNTNPSGVQGVCPDGWHVPSDSEWSELINYLGGYKEAGGKMKVNDTTYWNSPNVGANNQSGFTALGGGARESWGEYFGIEEKSFFQSTTTAFSNGTILSVRLSSKSSWATRPDYQINKSKEGGLSVRCVKD